MHWHGTVTTNIQSVGIGDATRRAWAWITTGLARIRKADSDSTRHGGTSVAALPAELFRRAADGSTDQIAMFRTLRAEDGHIHDFRIDYANPAWIERCGLPRERVLGQRLLVLANELPQLQMHYYRYLEAVETGRAMAFDAPGLVSGRKTDWVNHQVSPLPGGVFVVGRDMTERVRSQHSLQAIASHDDLTGLANRRRFNQVLRHAVLEAACSGQGVAVVFCDMDGLKALNDELGHVAGDQALVAFAQVLQGAVRKTDLVARLGGDEFVILLESLSGEGEALDVVRCIRAAMDQPHRVAGRTEILRASVGYAFARGEQLDAEALLLSADAAMYRDKRARKFKLIETPRAAASPEPPSPTWLQ